MDDKLKIKDVNESCRVDIKEEVKCPVCTELFNNPQILQCLHTLCQHCITQMLHTSTSKGTRKKLQCPLCRHVSSVNAIKKDFKTGNLVEKFQLEKANQENSRKRNLCEACGKANVKFICKATSQWICGLCKIRRIYSGNNSDSNFTSLVSLASNQITKHQLLRATGWSTDTQYQVDLQRVDQGCAVFTLKLNIDQPTVKYYEYSVMNFKESYNFRDTVVILQMLMREDYLFCLTAEGIFGMDLSVQGAPQIHSLHTETNLLYLNMVMTRNGDIILATTKNLFKLKLSANKLTGPSIAQGIYYSISLNEDLIIIVTSRLEGPNQLLTVNMLNTIDLTSKLAIETDIDVPLCHEPVSVLFLQDMLYISYRWLYKVGLDGQTIGQYCNPSASIPSSPTICGTDGQLILLADPEANNIEIFDTESNVWVEVSVVGAKLHSPTAVVIDRTGKMYVACMVNNQSCLYILK